MTAANVTLYDPDLRLRVGAVVRSHRLAGGWTLREVADELGVTVGYVSNIEHGRCNPTIEMVYALAVVLGIREWRRVFG